MSETTRIVLTFLFRVLVLSTVAFPVRAGEDRAGPYRGSPGASAPGYEDDRSDSSQPTARAGPYRGSPGASAPGYEDDRSDSSQPTARGGPYRGSPGASAPGYEDDRSDSSQPTARGGPYRGSPGASAPGYEDDRSVSSQPTAVSSAPDEAVGLAQSAASPPLLPAPRFLDEGDFAPLPSELPLTPDAVPFVGDVSAPNYWVTSSRRSIQHIRQISTEPWGLDVFQRTPDGQIRPSTLPALSGQLVPGVPVCIFVHGSFVRWETQLREAENAYMSLRGAAPGPMQMIFYTWPSDGPFTYLPTVDVAVRGRRAEFNGFHLAWLISQIPESCPVCLIGHSHGARVLFSALHLAGGGSVQDHVFPHCMGAGRRFRVILAAAAVDHVWLNPDQLYGRALNQVECVLNFRNRHDLALIAYRLHRPFAHRPLGKSGLTRRNAASIGWESAKFYDCDVTHLLGTAHVWPEYFSRPAIVSTMVPYLTFQ